MTSEFMPNDLVEPSLLKNAKSLSISNDKYGLCLHIENSNAKASLSLFGGHLLSFIPQSDQQERLWLSDAAIFDAKTPIRGGIPICWPWFAAYSSNGFQQPLTSYENPPSHGILRTQYWRLDSLVENVKENHIIETIVRIIPSKIDIFNGDANIEVCLEITFGKHLKMALHTHNKGHDSIEITQALHSYFKIDDIHNIHIEGVVENYADKPTATDNNKTRLPYVFTEEVDRIHHLATRPLNTPQSICIADNHTEQAIEIENYNNDSVVIWNPWQQKSISMKDMSDSGYRTMVCIEAANTRPIRIAPKEKVSLIQIIK